MSKIDNDPRKPEYDKFYLEMEIDKEKLIAKHEGYMCICCYCGYFNTCSESGRVLDIDEEGNEYTVSLPRPECCHTGIKTKNFIPNDQVEIDKQL